MFLLSVYYLYVCVFCLPLFLERVYEVHFILTVDLWYSAYRVKDHF